MPKLIVITDAEGRILGSVRADPIETEAGTVQFQVPARADMRPGQAQADAIDEMKYHELEVPEQLLGGSVEELHKELRQRIESTRQGKD